MAGIKDYSTTAGNNTSVGGVSIAEGMLPSNINNAFRAIAADVREWYNDSQFVIYGDGDGAHTFTYVSATAFRVDGANVTSVYHAGRRVKAVGSSTGTIFGTISSSSFSTNTTVNVTWDSGSLSSETLVIYLAALSKTNDSIPEDSISSAKLTSDSVTTAKITDANVTAAKLATNAVEAAKINANAVTEGKINAGAVTTTKIGADAVTNAKIANGTIASGKLTRSVPVIFGIVLIPEINCIVFARLLLPSAVNILLLFEVSSPKFLLLLISQSKNCSVCAPIL